MTRYYYSQSPFIDEVVFKETPKGDLHAYLHVSEGADPAKRAVAIEAFKAAKYDWTTFALEGKPTLEVRGFRSKTELIAKLTHKKLVEGTPDITVPEKKKLGWWGWIRENSLQASGVSMTIADIGYTVYGAMEHKWKDVVAGLSYLSGSTILSTYGRNDQGDLQIRHMAQAVLAEAQKNAYSISADSAVAVLGAPRKEGVLTKLHNFMREHPAEMGNMMYVSAGAFLGASALQSRVYGTPRKDMTAKQIEEMRKGGWGDTALGATTVASGLFATLVKEKAHDPDAPEKKGLARIWEWIQKRPLTIASWGYMGSTLCHAWTTAHETWEARRVRDDPATPKSEIKEAKHKLKSVPWRILFIVATIIGEILLSISSKGHGEGVVSDNTVNNSVIALTADMIARQPQHMQEGIIDHMGSFLGGSTMFAMKNEEVKDLLRQQVEAARNNPWIAPETKQTAASSPAAVEPPHINTPQTAWQAKLAAELPSLTAQMST